MEYFCMDDAEVAVVSYGCSGRSARAAVRAARARGIKVGMVRLITIWPFPEHVIAAVAEQDPQAGGGRDEPGRHRQRGPPGDPERRDQVAQVNRHDGQLITPGQVTVGDRGGDAACLAPGSRSICGSIDCAHIWCPGCGIGQIINGAIRAIDKVGLDQDKTVIVSGIGCSAGPPAT